ncbi:hypothetical protein [Sulfurimonas sp.]|uniref:hypothetical protein n=1 Tax=Sulfurimonas sp. TaxID=2022749 RepID=UPI002600B267|nr:hypothetical protein [Sulfurimonas sp.]MDD5157434.1 hypothetical protein [Sulfurimonas sp.]
MLERIIEDKKFAKLMQNSIEKLVIYLFEREQNFGVLCKIDRVVFDPELPKSIKDEFRLMTLFFLAGYTFETARIVEDDLVFEAGFGADNFGSVVSVPMVDIVQIIVDETPIFINLSNYKQETSKEAKTDVCGVENSMTSFLSNPENSKFLKK